MGEDETAPVKTRGRPRKASSKAAENKKLKEKSVAQTKNKPDVSVSDSEVVVTSPKNNIRKTRNVKKSKENDKISTDTTKRITRQTRLVVTK